MRHASRSTVALLCGLSAVSHVLFYVVLPAYPVSLLVLGLAINVPSGLYVWATARR